jgi:hypothetical protein
MSIPMSNPADGEEALDPYGQAGNIANARRRNQA